MVSGLDDVEQVRSFHFGADLFEKIEWTKWIARSLHEEDRSPQTAQNFITEFRAITHRAERISEADKRIYFFFRRHVAPNPSTHAFADQNCAEI